MRAGIAIRCARMDSLSNDLCPTGSKPRQREFAAGRLSVRKKKMTPRILGQSTDGNAQLRKATAYMLIQKSSLKGPSGDKIQLESIADSPQTWNLEVELLMVGLRSSRNGHPDSQNDSSGKMVVCSISLAARRHKRKRKKNAGSGCASNSGAFRSVATEILCDEQHVSNQGRCRTGRRRLGLIAER